MSDLYVGEPLPKFVLTINGSSPDADGNIVISGLGGGGPLDALQVVNITTYPATGTVTNHYNLKGTTGTFNLPTSPATGSQLECTHLASGVITIAGNGKNILGSSTYVMTANETACFFYDGTQWDIR